MDSLTGAGISLPTDFRALPEAAPLDMPTQSLHAAAPRAERLPSSPHGIALRRFLVIGGAIALTVAATREMVRVLSVNGLTPLGAVVVALFVALFAWIALSFTSAVAGFVSLLAGGGRLCGRPGDPLPTIATRTALLLPTYNESPPRVMAGLQAIYESLAALGALAWFDFFVLSDTTDPDIWIAEEAAFLALRQRTAGHQRIFYRHRARNIARKSGNIADWVSRFGAAYPQMLILDADSVMAGETLVRLVAAMERHPDVGLIQTLPVITGGTTLFARMQQFAGRVYGPLIAHGIACWHGAEGNYWGHNAIIRTRAFAAHAGLPVLPGPRPFGGHILSHDFVEAALLRRAGWAVHMVPALSGSYEAGPPSLIDLAVRDRRWCQGNLQHAAVLPGRGLHWVSRMHLLTGIGSYITAPLWLLFLLVGILLALQARFVTPAYFPSGRSLFPQWPVINPVLAMWMFVGTMSLLLMPKLLGCVAVLLAGARRGCGGALRLLAGVLIETVLAGLIAPVVMLTQSVDVGAILSGRDSGWSAQRRDDGTLPVGVIIRRLRRHTAFGLVMGVIAWLISPFLLAWMLPVVLGLVLAIPLAHATGTRRAGLALRQLGLLRIPEEMAPPEVLARAAALQAQLQEPSDLSAEARLLADPALLAAHRAMLPPPRVPGRDPLDPALLIGLAKLQEAATLDQARAACTPAERLALLGNATGLDLLAETATSPPFAEGGQGEGPVGRTIAA
jgi:membrane glycosyltransferase